MRFPRTILAAALGATFELAILTGYLVYSQAFFNMTPEQVWQQSLYQLSNLALCAVLFLLFRETRGTGRTSARRNVAMLAVAATVAMLHADVSNTRALWTVWGLAALLRHLTWIAFLLMLVAYRAPLRAPAMRAVAPLAVLMHLVHLSREVNVLVPHIAGAWMNPAWLNTWVVMAWNFIGLPLAQLVGGLSMAVFLVALAWDAWRPVNSPELAATSSRM